jgi:thiazole synthase
LALLLCASLKTRIVKLDVRSQIRNKIYPDNQQTLEAARELIRQDCIVLPMISPDPTTALRLQEIGCAALRVLAGVIGSKRGITNQLLIKTIADATEIPVIAEGGISKPSDVAIAMESGANAALVNTAIAQSSDPVRMASAMRSSVNAADVFCSVRDKRKK